MELRSKLYPYPVLSPYSDDYRNSRFDSVISVNKEGYLLKFSVLVELQDSMLTDFILCGNAEYVIHVECPQTSFRKAFRSDREEYDFTIHSKSLRGKVNICIFLVAKNPVLGYENPNFNEDYQGMTFDLEAGFILAMAKQYDVLVDNMPENYQKVQSIFSVLRDDDESRVSIRIDIDCDKIRIWVPSKQYFEYMRISKLQSLLPSTHAILLFPTLQHVLTELRQNGTEEYSQLKWYKGLAVALKRIDRTLDNQLFENESPFEISQMLLDMPVGRGLGSLYHIDFGEDMEE